MAVAVEKNTDAPIPVAGILRRQLCHPLDHGRIAVYGSTEDEPEQHFLGWLGDVDPDELFASGAAWGIKTVRRKA